MDIDRVMHLMPYISGTQHVAHESRIAHEYSSRKNMSSLNLNIWRILFDLREKIRS